ncbi:MAG: Na(+)/H(+) antiporter subunit B [Planctomycetota bacterium]
MLRRRSDNLIVRVTARFVAPLIQIFALYVLFHGHYSPGGGFQGGVMVAASIILLRLALGHRATQRVMVTSVATMGAALGALVFAAVGAVAWRYGGEFLDYGVIPFSDEVAQRRSHGILLIELGVALACICALVSIYDDTLTSAGRGEDRDD